MILVKHYKCGDEADVCIRLLSLCHHNTGLQESIDILPLTNGHPGVIFAERHGDEEDIITQDDRIVEGVFGLSDWLRSTGRVPC